MYTKLIFIKLLYFLNITIRFFPKNDFWTVRSKRRNMEMKNNNFPEPTKEQFDAYQKMFNYFNQKLFDDSLPQCLLNFSRLRGAIAFFAPAQWEKQEGKVAHEISLNPVYLWRGDNVETASALVHEMVHLWQAEYGSPGRRGYHNKEWATKMEKIGLIPSLTGRPGGRKTGERVRDYIEVGGLFDKVFKQIPKECFLPWKNTSNFTWKANRGRKSPVDPRCNKNKIKYSCPICEVNVWGKPHLQIICKECHIDFIVA